MKARGEYIRGPDGKLYELRSVQIVILVCLLGGIGIVAASVAIILEFTIMGLNSFNDVIERKVVKLLKGRK